VKQNEIVVEKMKEIIEYRTMYEHCLAKRGSCSGCPYWKEQMCTKKSTLDVLSQAADVFEEFLAD
jgi:hypothetical protein